VLFKIPHEARGDNIANEESALCEELSRELDTWFANHESAQHGQHSDSEGKLANEAKERLRKMGYLEEDFQ
jgi:hypothetical protein